MRYYVSGGVSEENDSDKRLVIETKEEEPEMNRVVNLKFFLLIAEAKHAKIFKILRGKFTELFAKHFSDWWNLQKLIGPQLIPNGPIERKKERSED